MRKALCVTLLLAALAAAALFGLTQTVNADRTNVVLTETTLYGDASAAERLTIRRRANLKGRLYWDITYTTPAAADQYVTEPAGETAVHYQYHETRQDYYEFDYGSEIGVTMESFLEYGVANMNHTGGGGVEEFAPYGLSKAYQELYQETAPGEETERTVRVADYLDYYPLALTIGMPDDSGWYSMTENEYVESYLLAGVEDDGWSQTFADFRQFFRIPVLPDETLTLSVGRNTNGNLGSMGSGSGNGDHYYIETCSAWVGKAIYFTINSHSAQGQVMDMSQIPGGYGIYKLPYMSYEEMSEQGLATTAVSSQLAMVYPFDPADYVVTLFYHEQTGRLVLQTIEDGACWLTLLDPDTMNAVQRIEVGPWDPEDHGFLSDNGSFLVVCTTQNRLAVLTAQPDDTLKLEFLTPTPAEEDDYQYYLVYDCAFAFDGEKLAVGRDMNYRYYGSGCDFWVMVYDKDGLQYVGQYDSSLNTGNDTDSYSYYVEGIDLELVWAKTA